MSATLDTVSRLVTEAFNNLSNEVKFLKDQLTQVQNQLSAMQAAAAAKATRSKSGATTHVGVTANGQAKVKFPNNTILWLKDKVITDPSYLPSKLSQRNYDNFANKHLPEFKDKSPTDQQKLLAEKIWRELQTLSESSSDQQSKNFASNIVDQLKKEWKAEKTAAEDKEKLTAGQTPLLTNGAIVADAPVLQLPQQVSAPQQSSLLMPAAQTLVTPVGIQLPLMPLSTLKL